MKPWTGEGLKIRAPSMDGHTKWVKTSPFVGERAGEDYYCFWRERRAYRSAGPSPHPLAAANPRTNAGRLGQRASSAAPGFEEMTPELTRCYPRCGVQFGDKTDEVVPLPPVRVAPFESSGVARVNRGAPQKPHQVSVRGAQQDGWMKQAPSHIIALFLSAVSGSAGQ